MINKTYVGIFFKSKSGGIVCVYSPDMAPRFWYFTSVDSINFIATIFKDFIVRDHKPVIVHINDIAIKDSKQLNLYNQFKGLLAGLSVSKTIHVKIASKQKIQTRVMKLLDIRKKYNFKSKLRTKKMHENQYNIVYEITQLKSNQSIILHRWAYLFAYYGYLKDKIKDYNKKEY